MKINKPYWFNVLNHFTTKRYCHNGLTIPFLIGARQIIEPDKQLYSISELLNEALLIHPPITLLKCQNINEYIIGIMDSETSYFRTIYKNLYKEFQNIIITDKSFYDVDDFNKIVNIFEVLYESEIQKGNFSKNNGKWDEFTSIDIERLKEILNLYSQTK